MIARTDAIDHRLLSRYRYALVAVEHSIRLPSGVPTTPIVASGQSQSAELMPRLVELDRLSNEQRDLLMEDLEAAYAVGEFPVLSALLESTAPAPRIHAHLASTQMLRNLRGQYAWFRLHDPRVWLQLPRILNGHEMCTLFGPITRWSACLAGEWVEMCKPSKSEKPATRYVASDDQWSALGRIGAVNRVLARNGWHSHDDLLERSAAIDRLVARARTRHGLKTLDDLVDFAALGMQLDPHFDEFPLALRAIEAHENERRGLNDLDDSNAMDAFRAIASEQWNLAKREFQIRNEREATP